MLPFPLSAATDYYLWWVASSILSRRGQASPLEQDLTESALISRQRPKKNQNNKKKHLCIFAFDLNLANTHPDCRIKTCVCVNNTAWSTAC